MVLKPLCFVMMPFGKKKDPSGGADINFDTIYKKAIKPALEEVGMEPVHADEELVGGIIHKPMFERLILCDFAIADLTCANPNVFYELGIRHAVRPRTTLPIFVAQQQLPFDTSFLRAIPYQLGEQNSFGAPQADALKHALVEYLTRLRDLEEPPVDSPVFQLIEDYPQPEISRLKTDVFRERVELAKDLRGKLEHARECNDVRSIIETETGLGNLVDADTGTLIDLLLSYRAVEAYDRMCMLFEKLPSPVQRTVMVREQYAFALNRLGKHDPSKRKQALAVLEAVVNEHGPSSETLGLMGRVYKDLWDDARKAGKSNKALGFLDKAAQTYVRGFEVDWRDAYPGINAVTLLAIKGDEAALAKMAELLPVVTFAVHQRLKSTQPDYWDYATLLELSVLGDQEEEARKWLNSALAAVRESFEPKSTANNLNLIRQSRLDKGTPCPWLDEIIGALENESAPA